MIDGSKRRWLGGESAKSPIRPPWSLAEQDFVEACQRCGDCLTQCEILSQGSGGFPEVDFTAGECTFCTDCAKACTHEAFVDVQQTPWQLVAQITNDCLTIKSVFCRSCYEACDARAINLKLQSGGIAIPSVTQGLCTGCGACLAVCPNHSITIGSEASE